MRVKQQDIEIINDSGNTFYLTDCFGYSSTEVKILEDDYSFLTYNKLHSLPKVDIELPPVELHNSQGVVSLLLLCFFVLVFALQKAPYLFQRKFGVILSESNLDKQMTVREIFSSYCLYGIALLMLSLLIFEYFSFKHQVADGFSSFLKILLFWATLILFFIFKHFLYYIYASILNVKKEFQQWYKVSVIFISNFGILAFIPVCVLVYSNLYHQFIIYTLLCLFLAIQLALIVRAFVYFISKSYDFLYLFVYFCALEIIPYIFVGFLLFYLYNFDFLN